MPKPVLGRGLGALLGGVSSESAPERPVSANVLEPHASADHAGSVQRIPLDQIRPCPFQPRREFSEESLQELSDSIREQGILQPLIVRRQDDHYELIAGERRWRAAQLLKLPAVPVLIRRADDHEVLELALIENLQRDNLNPLEEALGYSRLIEEFHLRQEDVASKVGKSRTAVTNALRLLKLPEPIQALLRNARLTVGHAKVILGLNDPHKQQRAADRIVRDNLNVRQTEDLVERLQKQRGVASSPPTELGAPAPAAASHLDDLESRVRERFGTRVQLHYRQGKGYLQIRFFNDDDLERILRLAGVPME